MDIDIHEYYKKCTTQKGSSFSTYLLATHISSYNEDTYVRDRESSFRLINRRTNNVYRTKCEPRKNKG